MISNTSPIHQLRLFLMSGRPIVLASVIELSGVERVQPPVHFSTPQLILKNYLGGQAKPPEQRSVTQSILPSACIQRFPTRVSLRMIRSSEATTALWIIYLFTSIDVTLIIDIDSKIE